MRNSKSHIQTVKQKLNKCSGIFYSYSELQQKYGEQLSKRDDVLEFKANVKLDNFPLGDSYTTEYPRGTATCRSVRCLRRRSPTPLPLVRAYVRAHAQQVVEYQGTVSTLPRCNRTAYAG